MAQEPIPTYSFEFGGGLASRGVVVRTSPVVDNGQPRRIGYWVNDLPIAQGMLSPLCRQLSDLIDVCDAIYIADRLALRAPLVDPRPPQNRHHRRLHLTIPVRCVAHWDRPVIVDSLKKLLAFLTDDVWSFQFAQRVIQPRAAQIQNAMLRLDRVPGAVILQSDGLDSLCGLVDLLRRSEYRGIVPVTVVTNPHIRRLTTSIIELLRQDTSSSAEIMPIQLRGGLSGIGRSRSDQDSSQRARAMLFVAAGAVAAILLGTDRLFACENGVGAIGLPMSADHWGARATKSMHPITLALMSNLVSLVIDRPFTIENLGLFETKGALVRCLNSEHGLAAARLTVSCDQATYMRRGDACGQCTSCILRRIALLSANLDLAVDGASVRYLTDWLGPTCQWDSSNAVHLYAMRSQAEQLRQAMARADKFEGLDRAFPDLFDVVGVASCIGLEETEMEHRLVRLYDMHVREFDAFVARIDRPGWGRRATITELIVPTSSSAAG